MLKGITSTYGGGCSLTKPTLPRKNEVGASISPNREWIAAAKEAAVAAAAASGGGEDFESRVSKVLDEAKNLLLVKHEDYGPYNIARAPGGAFNGLNVRLHDKVTRLTHLLDSGAQLNPRNESFRDTFLDIANYGIIGLMLCDKTWPGA